MGGGVYYTRPSLPISIKYKQEGVRIRVNMVLQECRKTWRLAEIFYCGIFPRFVERCSERRDHMSTDDPMVINKSRRELDREVENQMLKGGGGGTGVNPNCRW